MAIERVKEYFAQWDIQDKIQEFPVSSATVELAAQALSCAPARIAKTISFKDGEGCILIVAAGDTKIDNSKFKSRFQMKPKMLTPEEAVALIGHEVGGICPFAVYDGVKVYIDISLQRFTTVFPACGSANSAIELSCDDLFRYANSLEWVDVCKGWEQPLS